MTIERWLQPISDTSPSGPGVEYDPRFLAIVSSARRREEQQLGSSVLPAQDPDWHSLLTTSTALLEESRDLRLLVIWTYASFKMSGLEGLASGTSTLAKLLEIQWDSVHPTLEGDGDWYVRINAIAGLADTDTLLRALRDDEITTTLGSISIREACSLAEGTPPANCAFATIEQLGQALRDESARRQLLATQCTTILDSLAAIDNTISSRLGREALPPLAPLKSIIEHLHAIYAPREGNPAIPFEEMVAPTSSELPLSRAPAATLTAASRTDALRALSLAREYFERNEPSHPAALLIQRVERLATSSFIDIISELAPDSLAHVKALTGLDRS